MIVLVICRTKALLSTLQIGHQHFQKSLPDWKRIQGSSTGLKYFEAKTYYCAVAKVCVTQLHRPQRAFNCLQPLYNEFILRSKASHSYTHPPETDTGSTSLFLYLPILFMIQQHTTVNANGICSTMYQYSVMCSRSFDTYQ